MIWPSFLRQLWTIYTEHRRARRARKEQYAALARWLERSIRP